MNCTDARLRLQAWRSSDRWSLEPDVRGHIDACELCHHRYTDLLLERTLDASPVAMREGFADEAIAMAVSRQPRRQVFGWQNMSALAASMAALALLVAMFGTTPNEGVGMPGDSLAATVAPERQQTVQVVIDATGAQQRAVITIELADNLELEGYPEHRTIEWETALLAGKNLLALPFERLDDGESYFDLSLRYGDHRETIRVAVLAPGRSAGNPAIRT